MSQANNPISNPNPNQGPKPGDAPPQRGNQPDAIEYEAIPSEEVAPEWQKEKRSR